MNKLRSRISEEQLRNQIFAQNNYVNLEKDMSLKHVGISGMGLFTIDYGFVFIVSIHKVTIVLILNLNFFFGRNDVVLTLTDFAAYNDDNDLLFNRLRAGLSSNVFATR